MNILANAINEFDEASQLSTLEACKKDPQRITVTSKPSPANCLPIASGRSCASKTTAAAWRLHYEAKFLSTYLPPNPWARERAWA